MRWAALGFLLLAGCYSFSTDDYCAARPDVCVFRVDTPLPIKVSLEGGTVELKGSGFVSGLRATIAGQAASISPNSTVSAQLEAPPMSSGLKTISLSVGDRVLELPNALEYTDTVPGPPGHSGPPPRVDSMTPTSGSPAGGTAVVLTGAALGPNPYILVGGSQATVESVSADQKSLTLRTPSAMTGNVVNIVVNTAGGSTTAPEPFLYQPQWTATNDGLDVSADLASVVQSPAADARLFAIARTGGLFVSDGGSFTFAPQPPATAFAVAVDPTGKVWLETNDTGFYAPPDLTNWTRGGVLGEWQPLPSCTLADGTYFALTQHIAEPTILQDKLPDGGTLALPKKNSWDFFTYADGLACGASRPFVIQGGSVKVLEGGGFAPVSSLQGAWVLSVPPGQDSLLFASHPDGVYRIDSASQQTDLVLPGGGVAALGTESGGRVAVGLGDDRVVVSMPDAGGWTAWPGVAATPAALAFEQDGTLAVATHGAGVYEYLADGGTLPRRTGLQVGAVHALARAPDGRVFAGLESGLFVGSGAQWQEIVDVRQPVVGVSVTNGVVAFTASQVWRSADGVSWSLIRSGSIQKVAASSDAIWVLDGSGLHRSSDGGSSWTDVALPNANPVSSMAAGAGWLLLGQVSGVSRFDGAQWSSVLPMETSLLAVEPGSGLAVAVGQAGIALGLNGTQWGAIQSGLPGNLFELQSDSSHGYLYARSDSGLYRALLSGPAGQPPAIGQWNRLDRETSVATAFTLDPQAPDHVVIGTADGVFETSTAGR